MNRAGLGYSCRLGCLIGHLLAALIGVVAMPLRDALVDAWKFIEAAGTVAHGVLGAVNLELKRGNISGTAEAPAGSGWTTEPSGYGSRPTYNGRGLADVTAKGLWAAPGDAVTLAIRYWLGGGQIQGGWSPSTSSFFGGFGGHYTPGASGPSSGLRFYDVQADYTGASQVYVEDVTAAAFVGSPAGWQYPKGGSPFKPCLLWFRMTRQGGPEVLHTEFAADGAVKTGTLDPAFGLVDPTKLCVGNGWHSRGSVTQAALWKRAVSDGEIASFGDNLDPLFLEIEAADSPMLGPDGRSAIPFTFSVRRVDVSDVIATSGGKRETRAPVERYMRRYELSTVRLSDATLGLVRTALEVSRHGLLPVRWRHPTDDPAPPAEAPRYRIVNAAEAGIDLSRALGGQRVRLSLVLETV